MRIGTWHKTYRIPGLVLAALFGACQPPAESSLQRSRSAVAYATYPTTPPYVATAPTTDVYLLAKTFVIPTNAFDNPAPITMWGYVITDANFNPLAGYGPQVPGPTLMATEGTTLTFHVKNNLTGPYTEAISIVVPGQLAALNPVWFNPVTGAVTTGARAAGDYTSRVRSFNPETPPDNSTVKTYAFPNVKQGTYLYMPGTHPAVQAQMGLYGALIVNPTTAGQAYSDVSSAYTSSTTLLFSEIDPDFHAAIAAGHYGPKPPTPTPPDWLTSTTGYHAAYTLLNGKPYTNGAAPLKGGTLGGKWLIRFLNAGLSTKAPVIMGPVSSNGGVQTTGAGYMQIIAEDANFISVTSSAGAAVAAPRTQYSALLPAGKTLDAIITTPTSPAGEYVLHDRRLNLTNAGVSPGGALAFLTLTGTGNSAQAVQASPAGLSFSAALTTRTFNINNTGLATRAIGAPQITPSASAFSVAPSVAFTLTGGASKLFTVTYSPTSSVKTATLQFTTNDPATPVINVALNGT